MSKKHPQPLPGTKFTYLEVLGPAPQNSARVRCICGAEKIIRLTFLYRGKKKSCGCRHFYYSEEKRAEFINRAKKLWEERRDEILQLRKETLTYNGSWKIPKEHLAYYRKLRACGWNYQDAKAEVKKLMQKESFSAEEILQRPLRLSREQAGPSPSGE